MEPTQQQNTPTQLPANKPKHKTKTFVGLVLISLLVIGASAYAWSAVNKESAPASQDSATETPSQITADATMTVEVNKEVAKVGEIVEFAVYVDSGSTPTNAVGVVASYPKEDMEVVEVSYEGSKFEIQASESTKDGSITLERGTTKPTVGKVLVATVKMKPKNPRTTADLSIDSKSSLMASANAQNILGERTGVQIEIAGE